MRRLALLVLAALAAPLAAAAPLQVDPEFTELTAKPQDVAIFPVNITNTGEAPVRVAFEIQGGTGDLSVPLPPPLRLEPGRPMAMSVMAQTPYENGRMDQVDTFTVRFLPLQLEGTRPAGDEITLTFLVRTQGLYAPGLALPGLLAALGAVAVALGQKR